MHRYTIISACAPTRTRVLRSIRTLLRWLPACLLAGCAVSTAQTVQRLPDQIYTPPDWPQPLTARVFTPSGTGPFPAVLLVHGGGWKGRSLDDMDGIAQQLAESGYVAVNVAYRFTPTYRFPAQLYDVQLAMHWIHAKAETLHVDTDRIAALGYSSGAHLVSLLALVAGQGGELDVPYGGLATRPAAVIAGGTPSDLRKWPEGRLVEALLGGKLDEVPQAYAQASPITHVHAGAPPFFLFHGDLDSLVPPDHATDFAAALAADKVPVEVFMEPWRGHYLAFLIRNDAMREALAFLDRWRV
jgi:acetyl esterase/lipase